jgi:tetratricopeptide (TPR) repeat protein
MDSIFKQGGLAMSKTLNMAESLLAMGQKYMAVGRKGDAISALHRLSRVSSLPPDIAEEAQALQAEIYLQLGRFTKARRHLLAAITHDPVNAHYYYLMATAILGDERKANLDRAANNLRRCLAIDPNHALGHAEYGLLCLALGQDGEGMEHIQRAQQLEPENLAMLARLVEGLMVADRWEEAKRVMRIALFRNAHNRLFHKLNSEFRFYCLRNEQRRSQCADDLTPESKKTPTILPFIRVVTKDMDGVAASKLVRSDPPSSPTPPHKNGRKRFPGRRQAQ